MLQSVRSYEQQQYERQQQQKHIEQIHFIISNERVLMGYVTRYASHARTLYTHARTSIWTHVNFISIYLS